MRRPPTLPAVLPPTLPLVLALALAGCGPGQPGTDTAVEAGREITLPRPDLTTFEPLLRQRLEAREARAEERLEVWLETGSSVPGEEATALAGALGELGNHYHALLFLDAAQACYSQAARLDPEAFRWPYYLGVTRAHQGEDAAAAEAFEKARKLDPDHLPTRVRLGDLHLKLGELEAAREQYRRAVALDPGSAVAHFGLGRVAAMAGEPEAAVGHFRRTLELAPGASSVRYPLARALRQLGREEAAIRELEQHGEVGLSFPDPLMQRVLRLEVESAVDSIRSLAARPERLSDQELVNFAAAQLSGLEGALKVFRDRVETGAAEADAPAARARVRFVLGVLLARQRNWPGAARHLEQALTLDPDLASAHVPLAEALLAQGRGAAARRRLERALTGLLPPAEEVEVRSRLGDLALRAGDLGTAAEQWERALALEPDALGPRLGRALLLGRSGRYRQAAEAYERILADHPSHLQARLGRATALVLAGRPAEAETVLEDGLARLEVGSGDAEEQREVLQRTLDQLRTAGPP